MYKILQTFVALQTTHVTKNGKVNPEICRNNNVSLAFIHICNIVIYDGYLKYVLIYKWFTWIYLKNVN